VNNGSVDKLERVGSMRSKAEIAQIRPIVDFDSPDRSAIDVRDQWVALSRGKPVGAENAALTFPR
jgi:hypothetical protein